MTEWSEVEKPAIDRLQQLGWTPVNGFDETYGPTGTLGRENKSEIVLTKYLHPALRRLNPELPEEALQQATERLIESRAILSPTRANQDVYRLLKDGVRVAVRDDEGGESHETVRLIDWTDPTSNDFLLVSQFWVTGEMHKRRADLVGFVNGIPLLFIELKASHKKLEDAYNHNLTDYTDTIPQLFWYNGVIVLSNGSDTVVGSVSAPWEHLAEWKKINAEGEEGIISLDTVLQGVCEPARLLNLVENYTAFQEVRGGLIKILAKNHQYLGVEAALNAVHEIQDREGRLGVFWHTQGSGKSLSMVFFTQKVLRKMPGDWTFVIVTDRTALDDQIYGTFQDCGVVTEDHVQAKSGADLKRLLRENHRYVFTLIHKFRTEPGETYPVLSERDDIIVITDEAHRTQYDVLALNMRNALPNAAFLGFTGTPLIAGEEKTREVFGDYISIYDFKQSIDDGATVPLYYENRIPELQLSNQDFQQDMERIIEEAELDEAQEERLAREFSREYHLITRDDRLDKIAADLVDHFTGRGYRGKAMVVSIDKTTAVAMFDKVSQRWKERMEALEAELGTVAPDEQEALQARIDWMRETDMAVVVSQGQNEISQLAKKGLDIKPHRKRMIEEDLEKKFKDPNDSFRLVFVCAMWSTGFDVPSCSTIYLDKPMRNHTLMQTIARANRVFGGKTAGLIVDYIGVFRDLERALAIYGAGSGGERPVQPKSELVDALRQALTEAETFCSGLGIDLDDLVAAEGFEFIKLRDDAVNEVLRDDETQKTLNQHTNLVDRIFKAILPDPSANEFAPRRAVLVSIRDRIRALSPTPDITGVIDRVERLLERSVGGYRIRAQEKPEKHTPIDISKIDFEALKKRFEQGRKRIEADKLRGAISSKLKQMVRHNPTRIDYLQKLQEMIDRYNAGADTPEEFFQKLMGFARELTEEDQRAVAENLTEEELTVFDLLTKPEIELTKDEREQVKAVAHELLEILKHEKLVLDWRKRQQSRAEVRLAIEVTLDLLPKVYDKSLYQAKCDRVYQHIYDSYYGEGRSIYSAAA